MKRSQLQRATAVALFVVLSFLPLPGQCESYVSVSDSDTLQRYLCSATDQLTSNTVLALVSPKYYLNVSSLCLVRNKRNISITSNLKEQPVIKCATNGGLGFANITTLNISNVTIEECGALVYPLINTTAEHGPYFPNTTAASLTIVDCSDIILSKVTVTYYHGYAILTVNVLGVSLVSDIIITMRYAPFNLPDPDGSGMMVYYDKTVHPDMIASMCIVNSQFVVNLRLYDNKPCLPEQLAPLSHNIPIPMPHASALSVVHNQVSGSVTVTLSHCNISFNIGCPTAGMLLLYVDSSTNVTTKIDNNTHIRSNKAMSCYCHGLGLAMVTSFSSKYLRMKDRESCSMEGTSNWTPLHIFQTQITHHIGEIVDQITTNYALLTKRAGVVYLATSQVDCLMVHVFLHNIRLEANNGYDAGTGVYAETMTSLTSNVESLVLHLMDSVVNRNVHNHLYTSYSPGAVLTFINTAAVHITMTDFTRNYGSVIEAYNTDVYMSGNIIFEYNTAVNGAAMKLLGGSHLFLHTNLSAHFENNIAFEDGGAIYGLNDRLADNHCTFQVLSSNLTEVIAQGPRLVFKNNTAGLVGSSILAAPVYGCSQSQLNIRPNNMSYLYNIIFQFEEQHASNYSYSLTSTPARVVPCSAGKPQINTHDILGPTVDSHPGREFNLSLAAVDSGNQIVNTPVLVQFYHTEKLVKGHKKVIPISWWLFPGQSKQTLNILPCTNFTLTIHINHAIENECHDISEKYCLALAYFSVPDATPSFRAKIQLNQCPPGFQLVDSTGICECSSLIKQMNLQFGLSCACNIQDSSINFPIPGSWIGCYNSSSGDHCQVGIALSCLPEICNYSITSWVSPSADACMQSREGALCGQCVGNYSIVFGSDKCYQCTNWWILTLLFYLVAGIVLVVLFFSLRLTISTGTLNGLVFFANIASTSLLEYLKFQEVQNAWVAFNRIFLSLLNLSLGFPLCFYDGMTEMAKSWLLLAFPVYLLALVGLVVVVSRYSMRVSSLIYSSTVPVLVTIVYLSFSRLLLTVIDVFSVGEIYTSENTSMIVWLRDGSVDYFSAEHTALMVVSFLLAAIFILPYLILLLGARWWVRYRLVILYFKPIIDAAHGPFKENKQYWFSLRLILLVQQLVIYAVLRGKQSFLLYSINGPILIVFTVLHASSRPFKSKAVNKLDGLMMIILCLVYACTWYSLAEHLDSVTVLIASSLVTMAFLVFLVIIGYHTLLVVFSCISSAKSTSVAKAYQSMAKAIGAPVLQTCQHQSLNEHKANIVPQYREPLLDVSYTYGSTN